MLFIFIDSWPIRFYWTEIHDQWHLPIMATCKYVRKTNTIRKATRRGQSREIDVTALLSYWKDAMRSLCLAAVRILRWHTLHTNTRPHFSCNLQHWGSLTTLRSWLNMLVCLLLRSEPSQRRYLSLVSSPENIQQQSASLQRLTRITWARPAGWAGGSSRFLWSMCEVPAITSFHE